MPLAKPETAKRKLFCLCSHCDKANSCYQRDGAEDGRDRHTLFLFMRDLDRASVDVFVLVREAESACNKTDDTKQNKYDSNNCGWFHLLGEPF
jgi:hypothetical protein